MKVSPTNLITNTTFTSMTHHNYMYISELELITIHINSISEEEEIEYLHKYNNHAAFTAVTALKPSISNLYGLVSLLYRYF